MRALGSKQLLTRRLNCAAARNPKDSEIDLALGECKNVALDYGLKFQLSSELVIVFSTNLESSALMDPAFLRRRPNKSMIHSFPERNFLESFQSEAEQHGFVSVEALPKTGMGKVARLLPA